MDGTPLRPNTTGLYDDAPATHKLNHVYSSDFDLMIPINRKKAPEDMWLQRKIHTSSGAKNPGHGALEDISTFSYF